MPLEFGSFFLPEGFISYKKISSPDAVFIVFAQCEMDGKGSIFRLSSSICPHSSVISPLKMCRGLKVRQTDRLHLSVEFLIELGVQNEQDNGSDEVKDRYR